MGLVLNNRLNIFELCNENYFKKIKQEFILQDSRYNGFQEEEEIEDTNDITRFEGENNVNENEYNFVKDYLVPSYEDSSAKLYEEFEKKVDSSKKLKEEHVLEFFLEEEKKLFNLISKIDKFKLISSCEQKDLIRITNEFLDKINTYKQIKFPNSKINLNLSKGEVLILFYSLLEKGIIVGHSSSELFRLVENYFTYRDSKSNKDINSAYKALAEYVPNKTSIKSRKNTIKISNDLEEKLINLLEFMKKEFGEK
ncbi:hypothetical protein [Flavobacterium sp.]|uniref:hypothetical protein n=1 Tax=Flavobacterium sp. TaxID=239 RepID=UPI003D2DB56F